jgi:hypothetical protein
MFWPKVQYGLGATLNSFDELTEAMHKPYYIICPLGGVIRSAKRELRGLCPVFYGIGFPDWGIESIVETMIRAIMHFGSNSIVGVQLQM